ncbi:MAG: hypothetical protein N2036_05150 [Bryobacteraceae bacterium]|nr:hypothetical protein [Bryobacteraceae bacterium]
MTDRPSTVEQLVARAVRRQVAALIVEEACRAATAIFLFFALLLVTGAGLFHPVWILAPVLAAAVWAGWRVRRRLPDPYSVAQKADQGLGMKDLLATAWYLRRENGRRTELAPLIEARAEQACVAADVRRAVPLRWSRPATAAVAAFVVVLALFIARVGILRAFELRTPLVAVHFDTLTGAPVPPEPQRQPAPKKLNLPGLRMEESPGAPDEEPFPAEALRSVDAGDPGAASPEGLRQTASSRSRAQGEAAEAGEQTPLEDAASDAQNETEGNGDSSPKRDKSTPPQKQDSLLDRMRDALASLMDKFKLELPPGDGSRTASQESSRKESTRRERGQPQPGRKGEPSQEGELQSGQQQASDSSRQAKSEQAGRPDAASPNEKSGVGREEGRKELELAEQLEAMGRLDELIGKRAQNVQGEVMVEVTHSKNQSLRTPYAPRTGNRTDAGTELGRDEVPLHLQPYVQRYYEQVRKGTGGGKQP